ncbi:MAG: hypothetical protein GY868_18910 [Deltaproteobacteria bacterium]|nr:hypothetical protein [Deltaproteobacteria bacterium]
MQVIMRRAFVGILIAMVLIAPVNALARIPELFARSSRALMVQVAAESPLFRDAAEVELCLRAAPENRLKRIEQKILSVRMLIADGRPARETPVVGKIISASTDVLVASGERWVMVRRRETVPDAIRVDVRGIDPLDEDSRDNRFDILDGDEFNLFDVVAFPFRLVGMLLEFLFNVILFPFKVLTSIFF